MNLPDNLEQLKAAIELAADDEVFFIHRDANGTIFPCLLLNDTFFYACADAEDVSWEWVVELRKRVLEKGWSGGVEWAMAEGEEHKGLVPIPEVVDSMIWSDKLMGKIGQLTQEKEKLQWWVDKYRNQTEQFRKIWLEELRRREGLEKELKELKSGQTGS